MPFFLHLPCMLSLIPSYFDAKWSELLAFFETDCSSDSCLTKNRKNKIKQLSWQRTTQRFDCRFISLLYCITGYSTKPSLWLIHCFSCKNLFVVLSCSFVLPFKSSFPIVKFGKNMKKFQFLHLNNLYICPIKFSPHIITSLV